MNARCFRYIAILAALPLWLAIPAPAQYGPPSAAQVAAMKAAAAKPTPKTADGHPDLNGIWFSHATGRIGGPGAVQKEGGSIVIVQNNPGTQTPKRLSLDDPRTPPYKPEMLDKIYALDVNQVNTDPAWGCKNPGIPRLGSPHQIIQTPGQVVFLYSDWSASYFRVIPADGRAADPSAEDTYLGNSVAHWEGDTLVVDAGNFTEDSWIGDNGLFHSDKMHVIERLRREGDLLNYQATVVDPEVLSKPWALPARQLLISTEPLQEAPPCIERDRSHLTTLEHHGNPR